MCRTWMRRNVQPYDTASPVLPLLHGDGAAHIVFTSGGEELPRDRARTPKPAGEDAANLPLGSNKYPSGSRRIRPCEPCGQRDAPGVGIAEFGLRSSITLCRAASAGPLAIGLANPSGPLKCTTGRSSTSRAGGWPADVRTRQGAQGIRACGTSLRATWIPTVSRQSRLRARLSAQASAYAASPPISAGPEVPRFVNGHNLYFDE